MDELCNWQNCVCETTFFSLLWKYEQILKTAFDTIIVRYSSNKMNSSLIRRKYNRENNCKTPAVIRVRPVTHLYYINIYIILYIYKYISVKTRHFVRVLLYSFTSETTQIRMFFYSVWAISQCLIVHSRVEWWGVSSIARLQTWWIHPGHAVGWLKTMLRWYMSLTAIMATVYKRTRE